MSPNYKETHYDIAQLAALLDHAGISMKDFREVVMSNPLCGCEPVVYQAHMYWPKANVDAWLAVQLAGTPTQVEGLSRGEAVLFQAITQILASAEAGFLHDDAGKKRLLMNINTAARTALIQYADAKQLVSRPFRWNVPDKDGKPLNTLMEIEDHSIVRPTSYMEVHGLLGTSGCSRHEPYWVYSVMGVVENNFRGNQVVSPGDWIVEPVKGLYLVLSDEQYQAMYL